MVLKLTEVRRIIHPTDFSRGSEIAFAHALKLALAMKAVLEILHVDAHPERVPWSAFPSVRETLVRWNMLPKGASQADVSGLGISVYKATAGGQNPLTAIVEHVEHRAADMVVLASHHRLGMDRWLHRDVAAHLSRLTKKTTLFVPYSSKEFVAIEDGHVKLDRVLIPFDAQPQPQAAIDAVEQLLELLSSGPATCQLLHVGPQDTTLPAPQVPAESVGQWETILVEGNVVEQILDVAAEQRVGLIALTTQGHQGFLDALRGSTAEQILRAAPCPVLAVPQN